VSYLEIIASEFEKFQLDIPIEEIRLLSKYCEELAHWNRRINLTGLTGLSMVRRLVVEPVWIAQELQLRDSLVDVGSGNGSPAIPIYATCSLHMCHLVESRAKRAAFLRHVATVLSLKNVEVHRGRIEDLSGNLPRPEWITLQAVSLTQEIIDSIKDLCTDTTTVVWITSAYAKSVLQPFRTVSVPMTGSSVFLYRLDLS
jgi:16S rRNA (guanine(527)-N(7))-methyltransferase RsmG